MNQFTLNLTINISYFLNDASMSWQLNRVHRPHGYKPHQNELVGPHIHWVKYELIFLQIETFTFARVPDKHTVNVFISKNILQDSFNAVFIKILISIFYIIICYTSYFHIYYYLYYKIFYNSKILKLNQCLTYHYFLQIIYEHKFSRLLQIEFVIQQQ